VRRRRFKGKVAKNGGRRAGVFGLCGLQVVFAGESVRGYGGVFHICLHSTFLLSKRAIYGLQRLEHLMPGVFGTMLVFLLYVGDGGPGRRWRGSDRRAPKQIRCAEEND